MFLTKRFHLLFAIVLFCILISGCGPSPEELAAASTPTVPPPAETAKSTTLDILKAMDPTYEIYFDGEECIVEGPSELTTGEYFFILHNQTDLPATLWLASYFGEGSYDDHLLWRDVNCGGQGSHCEDDEGNVISYSFVAWGNAKKQAQEGIKTYYKLYDITYQRQYLIEVSSDGWWGWLCAPIEISQ